MSEQEQHTMILNSVQASGVEEWLCPTCGRRVLLSWSPHYQKIVLDLGDEMAIHSGGKGGVGMQVSKLIPKAELDSEDDPRLAVWADWIKKNRFDDWWDEDD